MWVFSWSYCSGKTKVGHKQTFNSRFPELNIIGFFLLIWNFEFRHTIPKQSEQINENRDLAAGHLSLFPHYITESHHRKDGIWSINKKPIDSVTRKESKVASHLSSGDSSRARWSFWAYIACRFKKWKSKPCTGHKPGQIPSTKC